MKLRKISVECDCGEVTEFDVIYDRFNPMYCPSCRRKLSLRVVEKKDTVVVFVSRLMSTYIRRRPRY